MTDHEKEILDKIKQSTEKTPVPESLAAAIFVIGNISHSCAISMSLLNPIKVTSFLYTFRKGLQ